MNQKLRMIGQTINNYNNQKLKKREYIVELLTNPEKHNEIKELPADYLKKGLTSIIRNKIKIEEFKPEFYNNLFNNCLNCKKQGNKILEKSFYPIINLCETELIKQNQKTLNKLLNLVNSYEQLKEYDSTIEGLILDYINVTDNNKKVFYTLKKNFAIKLLKY